MSRRGLMEKLGPAIWDKCLGVLPFSYFALLHSTPFHLTISQSGSKTALLGPESRQGPVDDMTDSIVAGADQAHRSVAGTASQAANFTPLFTVVRDTATNEHFHPSVEYFFCDDDPEHLSEAVLESIDNQEQHPIQHACRHIIIDLDEHGQRVVNHQSLAPSWQLRSASINPAPTFVSDQTGHESTSRLMLSLEGASRPQQQPRIPARSSPQSSIDQTQDAIQDLIRQYSRAMDDLKEWSQR